MSRDGGDLRAERNEAALILLLFLVLFLASVDNQLLIPLVPTLSREFGVSVARMGWVFSVYAFAAAACNLAFGPLTDRFGRVVFLRGGLLFFSLMAALTTRVDSFEGLLAVRAGMGLAAGLLSTCTASFVGDAFPYQRRGRAMGMVLSSYFAALIFGIPLSSWVADRWGWPLVFSGSSGLAAALALGAFLLMASDRRQHREVLDSYRAAYRRLLASRPTAAALVTSLLISGGTLTFLTYISGYLSETFGLTPVQISMVFLVSGFGAVLASPISGWLSDRWTKRHVFLTSNSLLVVPLGLLTLLGCGPLLFSGIFLISLSISFRQTALQTLQTELISLQKRGSFLALRNCFSQLGISLGVAAAGLLYSTYGYVAVTVLAALLTLGGSVMLFAFVPEPERRS
jgi:predicted MFS family arabinose efflux permease